MEGKEGYDSSNTMYSPDGRMYQVEYAREAIKRGTITCGIVYAEGILLLVEKKVTSTLVEPESIEKIFKIDEHIGCSMSGLVADARVLVDQVRDICQDEKYYYQTPITVGELVKEVSNIIWYYTFDGGTRPLGIGLLIGGLDQTGAHLYSSDPSGAYEKKSAGAIGEKSDEVEKILTEKYQENMSFKDAFGLLISSVKATNENKEPFLEMAMITKGGFKKLTSEEFANALNSSSAK
jgi:proteasome alpha subunit